MPNSREARIFNTYLKREGLKLTPERRAVFDEIFSRHQHFEADDLLFRLKQKHKKISRATIYRTLDLMVDAGVVGRVRFGESGYRYERLRAGEHHDHLICDSCGRAIEFYEPRIEELQDEVCARYHFLAITHSHQIRGLCRTCRHLRRGAAMPEHPGEDVTKQEPAGLSVAPC